MKKCFVIMPISDSADYAPGHFGRVYEFVIKPACIAAGFKPMRADEVMITTYIALDIIKHIVNSDMAICDLSGRNPNVLYELGIRQAFNLPVTLLKDHRTERIFDIQGFRDVEYDESLRIDSVQECVSSLAEVIRNTYENKDEVNSLVGLLGIQPAKISKKHEISVESEIILNAVKNLETRLTEFDRRISSGSMRPVEEAVSTPYVPGDYLTPEQQLALVAGDEVHHERFGRGKVLLVGGNPDKPLDKTATIFFPSSGQKQLLLRFASLRRIS